ncbi:calcium-binding protein [Mangrovicoccus sp. HB161399]|uniref:calcium-binding protein n=1 Tax=Mangrovicoccus sp. HB161399 TaxID=2720392 RepID=UPI0015525CE8|nr:calcium-binding protein [Mangrovicoccus sp. HB161399]
MTTTTDTRSETLRFSSDDQSMWAAGPAAVLKWEEYFPIIGGAMTRYTILSAAIASGTGKVTVDGGRIKYDAEGSYDGLARGATDTVTIEYEVEDQDGNVTARTAEIRVTGGDGGAVIAHAASGTTSTGQIAFSAVTAAEMLQDVHHFDRVVPVDIEFDALGQFADEIGEIAEGILDEIDRNQANRDAAIAEFDALEDALDRAEAKAGHIAKTLALAAERDGLQLGYQAAKGSHDAAKALYGAWEDAKVEEAAARAAEALALGTLTAAGAAVGAAEDAVNWAKDALATAVGIIDDVGDALGKFAGDVAYYAELAALETSKGFPWNWGSDAQASIQRSIDALKRNKAAYDSAQADKAKAESDLDRFADQLHDAQVDFSDAQAALNAAKADTAEAIKAAEDAWNAFSAEAGGKTLGALASLRDAAYSEYVQAYYDYWNAVDDMHRAGFLQGREPTVLDTANAAAEIADLGTQIAAKQVEIWGRDGYDALLAAANAAWDAISDTNVKAKVEVGVDAYAQAGLVVEFKLDGGSVDTDIDFDLTSSAALDTLADTFTITAEATNATTGESVAFETASPNMTFFAGLAYNAGATFDIIVDLFAKLAGATLLDYPEGSGPLHLVEEVAIDGILPLIDFDSRDLGFSPDIPGFLGDIFGIDFRFPTIETQGKAADFDIGYYKDVAGTSLEQLASAILDLLDLRLDYSPEFKEILKGNGASTEIGGNDLGAAIVDALAAVFESLDGSGDTDGDGYVPILMVKQEASGSLFHIDSIADDLAGLDSPEKAKFGFYVASGRSGNVFEVTLDVDQLIATLVNVALGNSPETTVNPLDISFDLYDLFGDTGLASDADIEAMKEVFNVAFSAELADLDVRAGAGFTQDFALSIDDIDYLVTFEDGTTGTFKASETGTIVFGNASSLDDTNGNGKIDYTLGLTPEAEFFNDTEVALNVGYTLDLIKAQLEMAATLPLSKLGIGLGDITGWSEFLSLGPILRLDGALDLLSADVFEDRFAFDIGAAGIAGAVEIPDLVSGIVLAGTQAGDPLTGTADDDILRGGGGADTIAGLGGDDLLEGEDGNDDIRGGMGADTMDGGAGSDTMDGGMGSDSMSGGMGRDEMAGGAGNDRMDGLLGNDTMDGGQGHDKMRGGMGEDELFGGRGFDDLNGGGGDDFLYGGRGGDRLVGGTGNDTLKGGADGDLLNGGFGDDELHGGAGSDEFVFGSGQDIIFDFEQGLDIVTIKGQAGISGFGDLDGLLSQDGTSALIDFGANELRFEGLDHTQLSESDFAFA